MEKINYHGHEGYFMTKEERNKLISLIQRQDELIADFTSNKEAAL